MLLRKRTLQGPAPPRLFSSAAGPAVRMSFLSIASAPKTTTTTAPDLAFRRVSDHQPGICQRTATGPGLSVSCAPSVTFRQPLLVMPSH